ncbi:MAG: serine hydrolase [Acidobacteriia bacterium]|nr:serine hydrolase [Terriglobia bacterium]
MTYPEVAAGGLWSTASDVARFVIELQKSFAGKSNRVLSTDLTRQMLSTQTPDWGLGIQVLAEGTIFLHTGSNLGYRCIFIGYPHTGEGAVVMTNAEGGQELRMEILRSIAVEYG